MVAVLEWTCLGCRTFLSQHACICPSCLRSGLIVPVDHRPIDLELPVSSLVSIRELLAQNNPVVCPRCYPVLKLGRASFVVVWGRQSAGKTSFVLKLADALGGVFVALEMGLSGVLADYARRLELVNSGLRFADAHVSQTAIVRMSEAGNVFLDSLSVATLTPADCERLARGNKALVVGTLQSAKDGSHLGEQGWLHSADVVIEIEAGRWVVTKSRFQPLDPQIGGEV